MHEWMQSDVRDDIKRLTKWVRKNRKHILIVLVWSIAMTLIPIKTLWLKYLEDPLAFRMGLNIAWSLVGGAKGVPRLNSIDYLFLFIASLVAGIILVDVETTLFSYIAAAFISFSIASTYSFFFMWLVLGHGSPLNPSVITTGISAAILSVLRLIFPFGMMITFFGSLLGAFARDAIQPSVAG